MTISNNINVQIEAFRSMVQARVEENYDHPTADPQITVTKGPKYFKIITSTWGQSSVFCFVKRENGDIMKAAGWSKPAKHARGNIFTEDAGASAVSAYGAHYR